MDAPPRFDVLEKNPKRSSRASAVIGSVKKNNHNQPECGDTPGKVAMHGDASGNMATCPGTWHSRLLQVFFINFLFPNMAPVVVFFS